MKWGQFSCHVCKDTTFEVKNDSKWRLYLLMIRLQIDNFENIKALNKYCLLDMYVGNRIPMKLFHYYWDEPNQFNAFATMVYCHASLTKGQHPFGNFFFERICSLLMKFQFFFNFHSIFNQIISLVQLVLFVVYHVNICKVKQCFCVDCRALFSA